MKMIDLINDVANDKAPKKIRINGETLVLDNGKELCYRYEGNSAVLCFDWYIETRKLNTEVEIIEEDEEIEKINSIKVPTISNSREKNIENIEETLNKYWFVINKLIEAVNKLKKGK